MRCWNRALVALAFASSLSCAPRDTNDPLPITVDVPEDRAVRVESFTRHLPGLDVDAEYTTTFDPDHGGSKFVRLDGGAPMSPSLVRSLERSAWQTRFGALSPAMAGRAQRASAAELLPVAVAVRTSRTPPGRGTAAADRDAFRADVAQRTGILTGLGLVDARASGVMPVIYGSATPAALQRIARHPDVRAVMSNEVGRGTLHAAPNPVAFLGIDTGLNASGIYGSGHRIGFIEVPRCGIYSAHERFAFNGWISHQYEPDVCGDVNDCLDCQGVLSSSTWSSNVECIDLDRGAGGDQCAWRHVSQAASCTAASDSSPALWGAAQAELFYANEGVVPSGATRPQTMCNAQGIDFLVRVARRGGRTNGFRELLLRGRRHRRLGAGLVTDLSRTTTTSRAST